MVKVKYVNGREGYALLTPAQAYFVTKRFYIESGLDIDTYLSLIDPDYHPLV